MKKQKPIMTKKRFWKTIGVSLGTVYTTAGIATKNPIATGIGLSTLGFSLYKRKRMRK